MKSVAAHIPIADDAPMPVGIAAAIHVLDSGAFKVTANSSGRTDTSGCDLPPPKAGGRRGATCHPAGRSS
ncbi:hypothetical protein [Streptomyces sp. NPDC002490]|uniref:hypothetical protein n=1 Tax=Streptomyces sp. NPDC002490 TaxID=3154416 RepID=UPI0033207E23